MWILFARPPHPDAAYWPGRRWLALIDGLAWPSLVLWVVAAAPIGGVVRVVAVSVTIGFAILRAHRALLLNERYRFTTWRLGVPLAAIWAIGVAAKVLLA
jgi:hypothetical protein